MAYLVLVSALLLLWFWWEKRHRLTHAMAGGLHEDISLPYEQEYELYHNDLSLCSKKARVCLSELGFPYKAHHIDLIETGSYETISRQFLKVNPGGILPVLVHNGHPIYESHDIISYAAARCADPDRQLVPTNPGEKELMQHWKDLASVIGDDPTRDLKSSCQQQSKSDPPCRANQQFKIDPPSAFSFRYLTNDWLAAGTIPAAFFPLSR